MADTVSDIVLVENKPDPRIAEQKARQDTLVRMLGELGGSMFADEDILHEGDKLVIPSRMTLLQAAKYINAAHKREEQETEFARQFMLEMTVDDEIMLSEQDFAQYVLDDWSWKEQFYMSDQPYSKTAADYVEASAS